MTRRMTPYTFIRPTITAKILRRARPCTNARRNPENFQRHADLGNDSVQRAFSVTRPADSAGGAGIFLRGALHYALLDDAGRRANGNSSGAERAAAVRDVFRAAHRGRVCGEPGVHGG